MNDDLVRKDEHGFEWVEESQEQLPEPVVVISLKEWLASQGRLYNPRFKRVSITLTKWLNDNPSNQSEESEGDKS